MAICKLVTNNRFLVIIITSIVLAINFRSSFNNINYHMDCGNYISLAYDPILILIKNAISILFLLAYFIELKLNKKNTNIYKKKEKKEKEKDEEEEYKVGKTLQDEEDLSAIESIVLTNRLYEKKDKFCFVIKAIISIIFIYVFEEIGFIAINNHMLDRLIFSFRILFALLGILILSSILFHKKMKKNLIKNFLIFKKHQIIPLIIISIFSVFIIVYNAVVVDRFYVVYYNINILYYLICCFLLGLELTLTKYLLESLYLNSFLILGLKGILGTIVFIIINIRFNKKEFFDILDNILSFQYEFTPEDFHIMHKIIYVSTLIIFQYLKVTITDNFGEMHFISSMTLTDILYFPLYCIERFAVQRYKISRVDTFIINSLTSVTHSISMLIFNEILELNFCGLNTNIRKNIILREQIDKENLIELFDINIEDNILDDD